MPRRRPAVPGDPERVQCGVRIEKRMLKVLKGLAEYLDLSLAEVLELVVVHAFEGGPGFSKGTLRRVADLQRVYEMDYGIKEVQARLFTEKR